MQSILYIYSGKYNFCNNHPANSTLASKMGIFFSILLSQTSHLSFCNSSIGWKSRKDILNKLTCCCSLAMCWLTDVCRAPVQDANSLRKLSSLSPEEFKSSNKWSKRLLSPLCSREYVCATFFTRLSRAGKITYIPEQIPQLSIAEKQVT